ncbi:uncharacterized protein LOC144151924 isoform X1 [Haemaphysalis longicornis]
MFGIPHHKLLYRPRRCVEAAILDRKVQFLPEKHSVENKRGCLSTTIIPVIIIVSPRYLLAPISQLRGPPGALGAGRACCLFRAKVLRLESPVCGRVGSRAPQMLALGEGFSLLGPEGGVRLGLRYAKALHSRLGAWSPHQQPPGMLQRRLPAGHLSPFSTLSRRRIDVAFTWPQRAGLVRQVRTPL